ncbi:MAG TPA: hypothetical protein DEF61_04680 [Firmicutes bacterium]|nr:hypothetical protein [Bacillota bacterium]HBX25524.1 hypothetical protein [Bacillota bacterium]
MKLNIEEKLSTTVDALSRFSVRKYIFPLEVKYSEKFNEKDFFDESSCDYMDFNKPWTIFEENKFILFKASFDVKKEENQNAYLCIDTFINGVASTIRPQGLLYLNKKLIQGIDINHSEVLLDDGHYEMLLHFYTHSFSFSFPLYFSLKYKDKTVEQTYFDFETILESLQMLEKDDSRYLSSLPIIDKAMNILDFRDVNSPSFFDSLLRSRKFLKEEFFSSFCGKQDNIINCIGHSHIDVAWLWDLNQTRLKSQRTFSTVLNLMDRYKDFKYLHTTPQLFEYLSKDNPSLFSRIKERVKEGRFELDGSMWVEADCNLTSGESLVRQFLYGINYFKKEFDVDCSCLFLPDVFGYSAQLPQIMKKCGINRFVTAKIGWNDTNRFPYDSFDWIGIDGSSVFTYLISTCDANPRIGVNDTTYTNYVGVISASQLLGTWNRYQQKDINNLTFTVFGYGDGGGGPTKEMLEREKRFSYGLPGLGKTRLSSLRETLDEIEFNFRKGCKKTNSHPCWNNELYFEYHRGTYTSVPRIKKNNRYAEFALSNVELFSTIVKELGLASYPKKELDIQWKILLQNQFHDILPGSSIEKVYLDSDVQFKHLFDFTSASIFSSLDLLGKNVKTKKEYLVFNPNGVACDGFLYKDNKCFEVKGVPSFGFKCVNLKENDKNKVWVKDKEIENQFFILKLNDKGEIISLFDKRLNKEFVKNNDPINRFSSFEDMPFQYDNWELTPYYYEKEYKIDSLASFSILDEGDRKGIQIRRKYLSSTLIQNIYLYSSLDRIDVVNEIDWHEKRQLLKIFFPLNFDCEYAQFDIQFGNLSRKMKPRNSFEEAKYEVYGQKWVDMSSSDFGLAILNDCKYGYGIKDGVLSLTVLKSGSYPYEGASDYVPSFTYSLYPHQFNYQKSKVIEQAYTLNRPLIYSKIKTSSNSLSLNEEVSFFKIYSNGTYLETIKQSEDGKGIICRLYEGHNQRENILIRPYFPFKKAYLCNLMEKEIKELPISDNKIELSMSNFEIATIKII